MLTGELLTSLCARSLCADELLMPLLLRAFRCIDWPGSGIDGTSRKEESSFTVVKGAQARTPLLHLAPLRPQHLMQKSMVFLPRACSRVFFLSLFIEVSKASENMEGGIQGGGVQHQDGYS